MTTRETLRQYDTMAAHEQPVQFADARGRRVAGILAEPSRPTDRAVLLCHGFLSTKSSNTNRALTELLLPEGISTFRFDWFGMGESDGDFADLTLTACLAQVEQALQVLENRGYARLGLIGSSFGGLVAVLAAATERAGRSCLAALGLKCPVPDFPEMLRLEFGETGMDLWKRLEQIPDVAGGSRPLRLRFRFYEDCLAYDAYKAAESIRVPVLIVQGECDEYVPLHQRQRLLDAIQSQKRLSVLPGANHGFSKPEDFRTMVTLLADWMITH